MCPCRGGLLVNHYWIVSLIILKFGTELGFDPGKTIEMFGLGAPIPRPREAKEWVRVGGQHSTEVAFTLHNPAAPGSILGVPNNF